LKSTSCLKAKVLYVLAETMQPLFQSRKFEPGTLNSKPMNDYFDPDRAGGTDY